MATGRIRRLLIGIGLAIILLGIIPGVTIYGLRQWREWEAVARTQAALREWSEGGAQLQPVLVAPTVQELATIQVWPGYRRKMELDAAIACRQRQLTILRELGVRHGAAAAAALSSERELIEQGVRDLAAERRRLMTTLAESRIPSDYY
jgi:hypothetical protein